jgi:dynein heavy chain
MLSDIDTVNGDAGMLTASQAAPRILYMRAFAQYFTGKPSGLNIRNIICSSPRFLKLLTDIDETVTEDYAAAGEYVNVFKSVRMVYDHGQTWDAAEYRERVGFDLRTIKRDLRKFRDWKIELDRMKISQVRLCTQYSALAIR